MELLQSLLAQPLSEVLGIGDALLPGGLRDAHIIELFARRWPRTRSLTSM